MTSCPCSLLTNEQTKTGSTGFYDDRAQTLFTGQSQHELDVDDSMKHLYILRSEPTGQPPSARRGGGGCWPDGQHHLFNEKSSADTGHCELKCLTLLT